MCLCINECNYITSNNHTSKELKNLFFDLIFHFGKLKSTLQHHWQLPTQLKYKFERTYYVSEAVNFTRYSI